MRTDNEALVIIDVQNDFCPGGALAVPGGDEVVARINAMMGGFRWKVLTQDWHPPGHSSFAESHPGAAPFSVMEMPYGLQVLWPTHCVQGTQGAEFHPGLDVSRADLTIRKGFRREIDSYSAFFENDRTTATGLEDELRLRGISRLTLTGLALDFCVAWSAVDAARLGFDVTVVESACRAIDLDNSLEAAREAMLDAGVILEP